MKTPCTSAHLLRYNLEFRTHLTVTQEDFESTRGGPRLKATITQETLQSSTQVMKIEDNTQ